MDPYPDSVPEPDAGPGFVMTENCKILQLKKKNFVSKIARYVSPKACMKSQIIDYLKCRLCLT
jgi:hypothetical protein